MNDEPVVTTKPAAPAGVIPAARTAQNITVAQRAAMNTRQRAGQSAAAPSQQPATNRVAATPAPAAAAAPSEGTPSGSPAGAEPTPSSLPESNPGAAPAAAPAAPPAAAVPAATAATPGQALAGAGVQPGEVPATGTENGEPAGTPPAAAPPAAEEDANHGELNGEAPEWLDKLLAGDKAVIPHAIRSMGRRIAQLTFEARTAQNALTAVNGETPPTPGAQEGAAAPAAGQPEPTNGRPAAAPTAPTEFEQVESGINRELRTLRWCERNRQGGTVTLPDGSTQEFTAEQVADQIVESNNQLSDLKTRRSELHNAQLDRVMATFNGSKEQAFRAYPWMKDSTLGPAEYKEAKAYLDANPHVRQDPNWPLVVGRYVTGLLAERKTAASRTPAVAPPLQRPRATGAPPPPVPGAPSSQPPRVDPRAAKISEAREKYRKSGSAKDLAQLRTLEREARQAAAA